ncbi:DUF4429 domain-containing protein [Streptomyces sp. ME19-01-6]|uniref:DUF4429 domain-containing protein n=1 Tax=Streptomyces sp. ME19-01-6 TaxID=3028686 RepID=UPI0029B47552|nr:DUF4429 domain-containing protein [Streptomyces sp. ME19-01-6]MDX3224733.1 DUF4429 domain-containing protein [Streptomyces sp. ME19-01-6]
MGDVLAGFQTVWEFDTDSVLIRFERGIRTPKLLQALGERRIPYEALSAVEVTPGKRGTVVLRAVPRPGADPLMDAADGQLKDGGDPYRLVLPAERGTLAEYYAEEIRTALGPAADTPAESYLVAAPTPPLSFKAYDGKASFDGKAVSFRWFWTGASSAKWKAGDQRFRVDELSGVEWHSPESKGAGSGSPKQGRSGYLRLLEHGAENGRPDAAGAGTGIGRARTGSGAGAADRAAAERAGAATRPDQDPAAVVFGLGYGLVHESLPFAAAVLEAVRTTSPALSAGRARSAARPGRRDPADIADRIRHLGELHTAGLLTDDEFSSKKAELLAEL